MQSGRTQLGADTDAPILIVGAGPTGLTLACELYRHGVGCRIVDRSSGRTQEPRAVDLQPHTLAIFEHLGLFGEALTLGRRVDGVSVFAGPSPLADLRYDRGHTPLPFAVGLPQYETERLLERKLQQLGGRVERQVQVTGYAENGDGLDVAVVRRRRPETLRARLIIGCDGVSSTIRELSGIAFERRGRVDHVVAADGVLRWALPADRISVFLAEHGYAVMLPMGKKLITRVLMSTEEHGEAPSLDQFTERLEKVVQAPLMLEEASNVRKWRVQRGLAASFASGPVLLAGDAAHVHSPVGGHGMNQGIQDAFNLGWKLALVARGEAPASLLDSYANERRTMARGFLDELDFEARAQLLGLPIAEASRDAIRKMATSGVAMRRAVLDATMADRVHYGRSSIVARSGEDTPHALLGRPMPQLPERAGAFNEVRESLMDGKLTVMLFCAAVIDAAMRSAVEEALAECALWPRIVETLVISAAVARAAGWNTKVIRDARGELHAMCGVSEPCAVVTRPDGYISYVGTMRAGALRAHLARMLHDPRRHASR